MYAHAVDKPASAPTRFATLLLSVEQAMRKATTRALTSTVAINSVRTVSAPQTLTPGAMHAAHYHLDSGGQRVRAQLALRAGLALGLSDGDVVCIASCCELLHNASLIHDDLQDRDHLRHGKPAVWVVYGSNMAICSGDLMLSAAYSSLCQLSDPLLLPSMLACVHERTASAIAGQCSDLSMHVGRFKHIDDYLNIARAKSGALLSLPIELALIAANCAGFTSLARRAAEAFSVSYQINDDLSDTVQDGARHDRLPCLNIVFFLEKITQNNDAVHREHPAGAARAAAKQLGLHYIERAQECAVQLPHAAGAFLLELAQSLRSVLLKEPF